MPLSPSSNTLKGVQAFILGLLTSFGKACSQLFKRAFNRFAKSANLSAKPFNLLTRLTLSAFGFLFALLGLSAFSQIAYAASYINASSGSGGTVSLGSIKPSSSGVSTSGSDTLTIHTDCSTGYSVYVSGQKDKDTNLTNTNNNVTSNNTIATSSTAVGSTATALSSNTWGLNSENTGAYVGLPTYANATTKALVSKSSVSESSTVPIYYGVKVDTSLTPGTYTGNVLYTVMMDSSCLAYTVTFNANGGSGTMNSQSIMAGTATNLTANSFTRSGYTFLGWGTKVNGKTETAVNGIGTEADVDYTDKAEVTDLTSGGSSITLYAIWEQDVESMQGWTGCSALSVSESVTLKDVRDNKRYAVKKLPDGKCWMMQNLTIGSDGAKTLTASNTNIDNNTTYYLPPAGKQGSSTINQSSTLTSNTAANFDGTAHARTQFRTKGTSTRDICPKGWRLPKTTDSGANITTIGSANDFTYLALRYNSSTGWGGTATTGTNTTDSYHNDNAVIMNLMYKSAASPLATSVKNKYAGFSYTGYWSGTDTSAGSAESYGFYWSSSTYDDSTGYALTFSSSDIYPQTISNKIYGFAVRCVAKS